MLGPPTPYLDKVKDFGTLKQFSSKELVLLAKELRYELISIVSETGGHLGAGLGVVELTIALHYIFNTPNDRIVWDVGHQAYPHKILTGRRSAMRTLRQLNGLSGFTKRSESPFDPFGAGHSSTSISAGLGMSIAAELMHNDRHVVSVIGDGALSAGMAYEAMNNAGTHKANLTVILNDNDMSIAPPTGAMSAYLARLASSPIYQSFRHTASTLSLKLPKGLREKARRSEEFARGFFMGGTLFEELGFYYIGPVDGHNFDHLLPVLKNVHDNKFGPVLIHVVTQKGKGYSPAEFSADRYHGVNKFDVETGKQISTQNTPKTYTEVFSNTLVECAEKDEKIVTITAAMPSGTGLTKFAEKFPERFFDVGIAEQHAVTFAAGLASEKMKPVVAIYSTFLQRAYDQIVHDVSLQNLPVRFAIDRAGLVGADGPTHAGSFDTVFLSCLPNFVVMAPSDETSLRNMVHTALAYDRGPISFRYPRGSGIGLDETQTIKILEIGKGRILKKGNDVALLSFGSCLNACLKARTLLKKANFSTTVADAQFAKPLDQTLIEDLVKNHSVLITIEEGALGGFGAQVLHFLSEKNLFRIPIKTMTLPDRYIDHGPVDILKKQIGLDASGIISTVFKAMNQKPPKELVTLLNDKLS